MTRSLTGLWRHADFVKLWAGQTVSRFGSGFGALALTALVYLDASPAQMGILAACQGVPVILFALSAGVWVDRLRRRPIMIAADIGRAAVLLSVPAAVLFSALRIEQLYLVAALFSLFELAFDLAYRSYLPDLIERENLVEGNSKLSVSDSLAEVTAPAAGGALVSATSGPAAVFFDALTFLWSAASIALIRRPESPSPPSENRPSMRTDIGEGLRTVTGNPILRALAGEKATQSFFGGFFQALYGIFLIRTLGFSPFLLGATIGAGGVGALFGAVIAGPLTRRLGVGPTLILARAIPFAFLIPLASGPHYFALGWILVAQAFGDPFWAVYDISSMSLRQSITPDRLLGRVNSTLHLLGSGIQPLGALGAGLLAEAIGVRETLFIGAGGLSLAFLWLVFSPIPSLRDHPVTAA